MKNYETIPSFKKDHEVLEPGFYLSGVDAYGIATYDLRFVKPNCGTYLTPAVAHTVEHCFATFARNGMYRDKVIYFGPMGCLTGFYLLMAECDREKVKEEVLSWCGQMKEIDSVPGSRKNECGNYLMHDLDGAKTAVAEYAEILRK